MFMHGRATGFALLLVIGGLVLVFSVVRDRLNNAWLPTRSQHSDPIASILGIGIGIVLIACGVSLMYLLDP